MDEKFIDTLLKVGIKNDYLVLLDESGKALPAQTELTLINDMKTEAGMPGISVCRFELFVDTRDIKVIDKITEL